MYNFGMAPNIYNINLRNVQPFSVWKKKDWRDSQVRNIFFIYIVSLKLH
jgi:hypothetical protein